MQIEKGLSFDFYEAVVAEVVVRVVHRCRIFKQEKQLLLWKSQGLLFGITAAVFPIVIFWTDSHVSYA